MNIRDIARLADVTASTVSKVLNNYPDISESTKQHVLKIIEENQYVPNNNARYLKLSSKVPQIGLFIEGIHNSVYEIMEEMLSAKFHNTGYTILTFHDDFYSQEKEEKFQELLNYIKGHNLNGLIYIGGNFESLSEEQLKSLPCPVIFTHTVLPTQMGDTGYSSVQMNHYESAYKQMSYLIQKGHTHISTVISSKEDKSVYGIRVKGYRNALEDHHLLHNFDYIVEGKYGNECTYLNLKECLLKHPEISGVCCFADIMAPAVIRAIHDAGKIPGKDVQIISFDGVDFVNYCIPSITTFVQPTQELIICIYDLLMGLISGEREHQHITFSAKLVLNESC